MFINLLARTTLYHNPHFLSRYLSFISSRPIRGRIKYETHYHHILPKAPDFFPQFKDLRQFPWNGIHLIAREHFIAHRLLHKAFPGSTQSIAFFNMANICGKTNSRAYKESLKFQLDSLKMLHASPTRNAKISAALTGRPKSKEHIAKLTGHTVSEETREKLRLHNLGKTASIESREKMSASRLGKKRGAHSESGKEHISAAKRGSKWYNNGTVAKQSKVDLGTGWVQGRLPK
jgi:hypothetical protein